MLGNICPYLVHSCSVSYTLQLTHNHFQQKIKNVTKNDLIKPTKEFH
jgi:hypothetical protein